MNAIAAVQHVQCNAAGELTLCKVALGEIPHQIVDAAGHHQRLEGDVADELVHHGGRRVHACGIDQHEPVTETGIGC